jgi:hypothetical protein
MYTSKYPEACAYQQHDSGLHEFTVLNASRQAVDVFIDGMDAIFAHTPHSATILVLIDVSQSKMPPITYAFQRGQGLFARHKIHAPLRSVYLHKPNVVIAIIQSYLALLRSGERRERRFMQDTQRDEAIAWLLSDVGAYAVEVEEAEA